MTTAALTPPWRPVVETRSEGAAAAVAVVASVVVVANGWPPQASGQERAPWANTLRAESVDLARSPWRARRLPSPRCRPNS